MHTWNGHCVALWLQSSHRKIISELGVFKKKKKHIHNTLSFLKQQLGITYPLNLTKYNPILALM